MSPTVFALWTATRTAGRRRGRWSATRCTPTACGTGGPREPNTAIQKILWHQDAHYYKGWDDNDGELVSVWQPLVPADERAGCFQLAVGSHRAGYFERLRGFNSLYTVPDETLAGYDIYTAEMNPGDVLLFSDLTLHQGLDNNSDYVRWSIDIRYGTATPEIISKTPRGYYCFSAEDPSRVEDYDTWVARYNYDEVGLDAEVETDGSQRYDDLDGIAKALGISRANSRPFDRGPRARSRRHLVQGGRRRRLTERSAVTAPCPRLRPPDSPAGSTPRWALAARRLRRRR